MYDLFVPIVKPETAACIQVEIDGQDDILYLKNELQRLDKENPTISNIIRSFSKTTKDKIGAAWCGLLVYKFIERQAESNKMNFELNLGDNQIEG